MNHFSFDHFGNQQNLYYRLGEEIKHDPILQIRFVLKIWVLLALLGLLLQWHDIGRIKVHSVIFPGKILNRVATPSFIYTLSVTDGLVSLMTKCYLALDINNKSHFSLFGWQPTGCAALVTSLVFCHTPSSVLNLRPI